MGSNPAAATESGYGGSSAVDWMVDGVGVLGLACLTSGVLRQLQGTKLDVM